MTEITSKEIKDTLVERGSRYGSWEDNSAVSQHFKTALWTFPRFNRMPAPHREAMEMIVQKMARTINGDCNYADNWHDIAGYAKLMEDLIGGVDSHAPTVPTPAAPSSPSISSPSNQSVTFKHINIMIDIETTGTKPGCMVWQVGAYCLETEDRLLAECNPNSDDSGVLIMDTTTVRWQRNENKVNWRAAMSLTYTGKSLAEMIGKLDQFIRKYQASSGSQAQEKVRLWCKGTDFDFPILQYIYEYVGLTIPWSRHEINDLRTLCNVLGSPVPTFANQHNALGGCSGARTTLENNVGETRKYRECVIMTELEYFPPDMRTLQKEIRNHPPLVEILSEITDLGEWFAEIATYGDVIIEGYFYPDQFPKLCRQLTDRLYAKRSAVLMLPSMGAGRLN